ncbi:flagellar hook-length control protein FliK [Iodobacter fluviatilis]|uniref:Flagellar hook-length control protein FliK n=1 Tax=Iodobacter fluviatilis TaxID=537 RepID=A0A377Q7Q4_9NEIS|nr:flagellar hook-length control protein FliK [Iodobacter fluviatilis]TCU89220.1 flagellar hook-length control protein FliK [Iodobacter fluviatilis]STQ90589.1 Flagellar hook-length control protein FliK [Iodobacter fluviatilis]
MLPGTSPISLVQHYLKAQEGVAEVTRISADDVRYTVGERVHATVASLLPNGRFAVLIKDQLLDLNLPRNTEPGEKLDLTVVTSNPKLTFSINSGAAQQPALPQEMALSQGARFLSSLLAKGEAGKDGLASVLNQAQPLFEGVPDTAKLADKLAQKLADSGLFYESHQAEWVNGERPLQALLKEPQAGLLKEPLHNTAASSDGAEKNTALISPKENGTEKPALAPDASAALRHLVQQQLDVLEQRPVVWNGQAWPGQAVRWEVAPENEREASGRQEEMQRSWQSRMDLQLPNLGDVGIVAVLRNGEFSLRFEASAETADKIRAETKSLQNRFEAAGLTLVSSQVVNAGSVNVT